MSQKENSNAVQPQFQIWSWAFPLRKVGCLPRKFGTVAKIHSHLGYKLLEKGQGDLAFTEDLLCAGLCAGTYPVITFISHLLCEVDIVSLPVLQKETKPPSGYVSPEVIL